jgi:AraC-like DNA-binding protein
MTHFPQYLKHYPNMHTAFPFHLSLNKLANGYPAHRHDFLEFSFVVEGDGAEAINGVKHPMVPGTFTFILPYQVHEIFTSPGSTLVLYNCMFSLDLLMDSGISEGFGGWFEDLDQLPSFVPFREQDIQGMLGVISEMHREYTGENRWRETLLRAKLWETLVRFDRYRQVPNKIHTQPTASVRTKSSIWPIIHHIHNNYQEELMLSGLAEKFNMSVSRMSEVIKQATGQTFVHFLQDLRIRHATGLLASTEMSVMEIAHEVGYGSYKTFVRIFLERKGMSPTSYRKSKKASSRTGGSSDAIATP